MIVVYRTKDGTRWFEAKSILKKTKKYIHFIVDDDRDSDRVAIVKKEDIVKIWKDKEME